MKQFVVKSLEVLASIGFVLVIIFGAIGGYRRALWAMHFEDLGFGGPIIGLVIGAAGGFVLAVVVFGVLFLVMDIADNARRTRELIEAEAARHGRPV